ncbi:hypothetical protein E1267_34220 [Nonomuraea longispora]|uniref:Uncharacterized protein n=1 Tax=Nonomuraea longispora TaxID=1848320 RepID=A0A4R4N377_9ACTN|nr:hypothetical protein [Nonomuraea longispora]TDC00602.1 hypothetical protein E1267_34220 [Nonomuraea longispora]
MTLSPYTYVTVSMRPGQPSRISIAFCSAELRASAWLGENGKPCLNLDAPDASVTVSTSGPVTEDDLTVAREIFNSAARYLADCERLHLGESHKATDGEAA